VGPVPVQMWAGFEPSPRADVGRGAPSPRADVAGERSWACAVGDTRQCEKQPHCLGQFGCLRRREHRTHKATILPHHRIDTAKSEPQSANGTAPRCTAEHAHDSEGAAGHAEGGTRSSLLAVVVRCASKVYALVTERRTRGKCPRSSRQAHPATGLCSAPHRCCDHGRCRCGQCAASPGADVAGVTRAAPLPLEPRSGKT
jgi:hypothetical protein